MEASRHCSRQSPVSVGGCEPYHGSFGNQLLCFLLVQVVVICNQPRSLADDNVFLFLFVEEIWSSQLGTRVVASEDEPFSKQRYAQGLNQMLTSGDAFARHIDAGGK